MPREQTMNECYLSILDTISAEEPLLRQYMADIAAEIKEPYTMERETAISLCRAFEITYNYHRRYNLDLYELIDFVTEQTFEILQEQKLTNDNTENDEDDENDWLWNRHKCRTHNINYISHLIRYRFPLKPNVVTLNASKINATYQYFYEEKYQIVYIDGMKSCRCVSSQYREPLIEGRKYKISDCFPYTVPLDKLGTTIYTIEQYIEQKELFLATINDPMARLTPREVKVMRLIFGIDDAYPRTLEEVGRDFGVTRERARQIVSSAFRKLCRRGRSNYYYNSRYKNYTSICKCGQRIKGQIYPVDNFSIYVFCCKNCGRIYYSQLGQYKATCLRDYRLKGYIEKPSNSEIPLADVFIINGNVPVPKPKCEQSSKIHEWVERLRHALEK